MKHLYKSLTRLILRKAKDTANFYYARKKSQSPKIGSSG